MTIRETAEPRFVDLGDDVVEVKRPPIGIAKQAPIAPIAAGAGEPLKLSSKTAFRVSRAMR